MIDTDPGAEKKYNEMMRSKSAQERALMGFSMFNMAKQVIISSIFDKCPNADETTIRRELFLRFYGDDFDEVQKHLIVKYLSQI